MRRIIIAALGLLAANAASAEESTAHASKDARPIFIMNNHDDDGSGSFWMKSDALDLRASWTGEFEFAADGRSLDRLDGRLEIEWNEDGVRRRAVFTGRGSSIETAFDVNGAVQPAGAATEKETGDLLLSFLRVSGMRAHERVGAMLRSGGAQAALAEIAEIQGGHAAMRYIVALSEQAALSPGDIDLLARRIASFDADHSKRRAIEALVEHQSLSAGSREALLEAASGVTGDHDLRRLIEAFAEREMTAGAAETAMKLLARISGDHEFRTGAQALLENPALSDRRAAEILGRGAEKIGSDQDLRRLIEAAAGRVSTSDLVAGAAIAAAESIASDHDRRRALETIAESLPERSGRWAALIKSAGALSSDREARRALETIIAGAPDDPLLLEAYRAAAANIGSDREREEALAAIGER